jgi:hypothetical protein
MANLRALRIGIASAAIVSVTSAPAIAIDLTGTWQGTLKCTTNVDGQKPEKLPTQDVTFLISHVNSTDLNVSFNSSPGQGTVVDAGSSTTKGLFVSTGCPGHPFHFVNGKASIGTKSSKISGDATFFASGVITACKVRVERTDTTDPGAISCP